MSVNLFPPFTYRRIGSPSPIRTRSFQLSASQRQPPQGYIFEWLRGTYYIPVARGYGTPDVLRITAQDVS